MAVPSICCVCSSIAVTALVFKLFICRLTMRLLCALSFALLLQHTAVAAIPAKRSYDTHHYYVIEHVPHVTHASLDDILKTLDVELVEQAGELKDHWLVRTPKHINDLTTRSESQDRVLDKFESLRVRAESSFLKRSPDTDHARRIVSAVKYLSRQDLQQRHKRAPPPIRPGDDSSHPENSLSRAVATRLGIQDPLFPQQWHLVNDEFPQHMMNATPVWEMGFTGKGIISSLVDDGLDYTSEDLVDNFVRLSSILLCSSCLSSSDIGC